MNNAFEYVVQGWFLVLKGRIQLMVALDKPLAPEARQAVEEMVEELKRIEEPMRKLVKASLEDEEN